MTALCASTLSQSTDRGDEVIRQEERMEHTEEDITVGVWFLDLFSIVPWTSKYGASVSADRYRIFSDLTHAWTPCSFNTCWNAGITIFGSSRNPLLDSKMRTSVVSVMMICRPVRADSLTPPAYIHMSQPRQFHIKIKSLWK